VIRLGQHGLKPPQIPRVVIDPESPWKLRRTFATYGGSYTMPPSEWRALLARAEAGDGMAEWEVSGRYEDGCKDKSGRVLLKRSPRKAAEWLKRSAEHGCTPAQNALGVLLGRRNSSRKNTRSALEWLGRAFRAGDTLAAHNIATTHRENGNLKKAAQWFRKSTGDGDSLIQLGIHYYWGKGIRMDAAAAVRCFRRAMKENICEAGKDDAFFYLGIAYLEGKGVSRSLPTAKKMLQRADIDGDHPPARRLLRHLMKISDYVSSPTKMRLTHGNR